MPSENVPRLENGASIPVHLRVKDSQLLRVTMQLGLRMEPSMLPKISGSGCSPGDALEAPNELVRSCRSSFTRLKPAFLEVERSTSTKRSPLYLCPVSFDSVLLRPHDIH